MNRELFRPPSQERLAQAAELLRDGASQHEVARTTGISTKTLRKHFPGQGWTHQQGGEFTALNRYMKVGMA